GSGWRPSVRIGNPEWKNPGKERFRKWRQRRNRLLHFRMRLETKLPMCRLLIGAVVAAPGWWPSGAMSEPVTFNKHIAPILFEHCATCHRPGQAGPFALLTCTETRKHARQIAEVTASRYMPPWLPQPGYGECDNAAGLT